MAVKEKPDPTWGPTVALYLYGEVLKKVGDGITGVDFRAAMDSIGGKKKKGQTPPEVRQQRST